MCPEQDIIEILDSDNEESTVCYSPSWPSVSNLEQEVAYINVIESDDGESSPVRSFLASPIERVVAYNQSDGESSPVRSISASSFDVDEPSPEFPSYSPTPSFTLTSDGAVPSNQVMTIAPPESPTPSYSPSLERYSESGADDNDDDETSCGDENMDENDGDDDLFYKFEYRSMHSFVRREYMNQVGNYEIANDGNYREIKRYYSKKMCTTCWQHQKIGDDEYWKNRRSRRLLYCQYDFERETERENRRRNYLVHVRTIVSASDLDITMKQYGNCCFHCHNQLFKVKVLKNFEKNCDVELM